MSSAGKVDQLHMLALQLACIPPVKPYKNAHTCYVPWSLVEDIRREFERRGVSWRAIRDPVCIERGKEQRRWVQARLEARKAGGK